MHQWLVKKGRIGLSVNEQNLLLEIDTGGNGYCLLTGLDTKEVSELMTDYTKQLWDDSTEKEEYKQIYSITSEDKYSWKNSDGEIQIGLNIDQELVEIKYQGNMPCHVSVNQAVEIIQVLQSFISD